MERYRKKDILQAVAALMRANDSIARAAAKDPSAAAEALMQCQESAIQIGTCFENMDAKYTALVGILEDYCEDIYQMSMHIADDSQFKKLSKKIRKQLTALQNKLVYETPDDKKEVVFLPYKASMWDSLESVWKAARDDENTDAYVIPIPYYDKNPDGSFREEHYEGDLYPAYVPITGYKEYNIEMRRPDAIFIHNPYDNGNYVTSVHPFFYAKNLRQYTDQLIYIPYFVLGEIEPDNQAAVEQMKHFCFLAGVIYAHKVIVQSEKMRQIYINEYAKAAKQAGLSGEHTDRGFLEKKILGLGSPKVDKVLKTRKDDLNIPKEWQEIIKKTDGSMKKIVLYNTSINALLQFNEQMLEKMKDVFLAFYAQKDEVALIWRPHPLIESTLTSMRPQLWEAYQKIRDSYREAGWGIYDDTSDLERAVVLCDMYYGDGSSVVHLFEKIRKIRMIQNINVLTTNCVKKEVFFESCEIINNEIWFSAANCNGLFQTSLSGGNTEFIGFFDESMLTCRLHRFTAFYENKIFFVPFHAKYISVYDMEQRLFEKIEIPQEDLPGKFYSCAAVGNYLYCIPHRISSLIVINMETCKIHNICNLEQEIRSESDEGMFRGDWCVYGDSIWMASMRTNLVVEYKIKQDTAVFHYIGSVEQRFITICNENEIFYLMDTENNLTKWNAETNETKVFGELGNLYNAPPQAYVSSVKMEKKILFLPTREAQMVSFDIEREKFYKIENKNFETEIMDDGWWDRYCCHKLFDGKLHLFSAKTKLHYMFYKDEVCKTSEKYALPEEYSFRVGEQLSTEDSGAENEIMTLSLFISSNSVRRTSKSAGKER